MTNNLQSELAALRARVAELESAADKEEQHRKGNVRLMARVYELEQRNAELEAALQAAENYLRPYAEIHDLPEARRIAERIAHILARAESAAPAKRCEDCAPEFGCWDGGEPCYKRPLVKSTQTQEPCGGRCGDPDCGLDTTGVAMRTPAPHADTVRGGNTHE